MLRVDIFHSAPHEYTGHSSHGKTNGTCSTPIPEPGGSPLGLQAPQATLVRMEVLSPINHNESLCNKIDTLARSADEMNKQEANRQPRSPEKPVKINEYI